MSSSFVPLSEIRKAIGEQCALWLEQKGSILPPHPDMLYAYVERAQLGRPFTEKALSEAERNFRKKDVSLSQASTSSSTKELQALQEALSPTPSFLIFRPEEYYQKKLEIGLYPSVFCAYPNVEPYHLGGQFVLTVVTKKYPVQFFALFETVHHKTHRLPNENDCSYATEIFETILKKSLEDYNTRVFSIEGVKRALNLAFSRFRDQIGAVGYRLSETTATAALIIDKHLWTVKVGPSGAFISSKVAMKETDFFHQNLEKSTGDVQGLWDQAEMTITPLEKIPKGSFGVVGSGKLLSKISPKAICKGIEVYQAKYRESPLSRIAESIIFSARLHPRSPVQEASVILFAFEGKEEDYVLVGENDFAEAYTKSPL